eukprot:CAMPEP_0113967056 /NCGR_PEP_ID=MMETSP0011_2-20120614/8688_1 /TAXON_ID=101924 /ORGANISM="Rhodosorus marinus" /LENGTH=321 /DNA_ID=CAMNT_0000979837 /DNA_START=316 /DNA_END=1281 /DNA_ORIENTATION=+ /assembly_acc=CAM_ASM_000156
MAFLAPNVVHTQFGRSTHGLAQKRLGGKNCVLMRQNPYGSFFKSLTDFAKGGTVKMSMQVAEKHAVLGNPMEADFASQGLATALVGLGCFWGAERKFWEMKGVHSTAVGYSWANGPFALILSRFLSDQAEKHAVLGNPMEADFASQGLATALVGLGCFWGAERKFWEMKGVHSTAVGYSGGSNAQPSYKEVCSGATGHAEVVRIIYDPAIVSFGEILDTFWDSHDPTTLNRQGNDVGSQYRSVAYYSTPEEKAAIEDSRDRFSEVLQANGYGPVVTEVSEMPTFYFAEDYHQQYLHKNPWGYCGLGGTGLYPLVKEAAAAR